jgi:methyl-accepting chemotaxis protein
MAIVIPVLTVLILSVAAMVVTLGISVGASTDNLTDRIIDARVGQYLNAFMDVGNSGYASVSAIAPAIEELSVSSVAPRTRIIEVMTRFLNANDSILAVWTAWEPDALDGLDAEYANADAYHDETGRYVPYVYRSGGQIITEPLRNYDDPIDGLYYQGAKTSGRPYITDPYDYSLNGETVTIYSITIPLFKNGSFAGAVGVDVSLDAIQSTMNAASILDDGYFCVISPSGTITSHPNTDMVGEHYDVAWLKNYRTEMEGVLLNGGQFNVIAFSDVTQSYVNFMGRAVELGETGRYWAICAFVPMNTVNAASDEIVTLVIVIGAALITITGLLSFALISRNLKRLPSITALARRVAEGDISIAVNKSREKTKNEITLLEATFADLIETIRRLVTDIQATGKALSADGDIDARMDTQRFTGAYKEATESINRLLNDLTGETISMLECMTAFGAGDFKADIPRLPGKKIVMNTTLNTFRDIVTRLHDDITTIAVSASEGDLSKRVDTNLYNGEWAALMAELNELTRAIAEPIDEAAAVMSRVSEGDFGHRINGAYNGDFLKIKNAVNTTAGNIASYIQEISEVLGRLAANDLNQAITREYVGSFRDIKDAINNIVDTLNRVISEIGMAAEQVAAGAKSISESSMTLATGATEQAASVQQLNATVLTINENTGRNADNARNAEALSNNSKANAAKGDNDMKRMLASMEGIRESSEKITNIIKVIDDISMQTNLLALNASVEAARAGEYGRGFGVVAEEVRTLASRSQTAAYETSKLIDESINRVNEGMLITGQTAEALRLIVSDVDKVSEIISGIAIASAEQTEAVGQVTDGLTQITEVVQTNSATSEEAASASQQMASQSEVMRSLVNVFKLRQPK